jgi:hypothetical protein
MSATVSKVDAYVSAGPGDDVAVVTKVTAYLVIDTNTVVDPGEVPPVNRQSKWTARIVRKAG